MSAKKKLLRCRVTAHLQGGARPGDIVEIDPTDAWMAAKIPAFLVPLDPWEPPATAEPVPEPPVSSPAASGDDPTADPDETVPVDPDGVT